MATILYLPTSSSCPPRSKLGNSDLRLLDRLVQVSRELQAIQHEILGIELDPAEKLAASEATLTAVKGVHQTACTLQASISSRMAATPA